MILKTTQSVLLALSLLMPSLGFASKPKNIRMMPIAQPISLEVISDLGRAFTKYELSRDYQEQRAYLEAKKGKRYKLKIKNLTNRRIGVAIAVDGRNIISGKKSYLKPNERMYVLGPNQSSTIKGWRTSQNKVNRFYFTNAGNSYASAWGDHSAMGVIAAAVYHEKFLYRPMPYSKKSRRPILENSTAADTEAGTGYGREEHSASTTVKFRPQTVAASKYFYKYEWRKTLCEKGIIHCKGGKPKNRFWPHKNIGHDNGYVPPPPK